MAEPDLETPPELVPTPDDGRRLAPEPVWDETTRPHASQDAAASPTPRGLAAAGSLLKVHQELRELLERTRSLVVDVVDRRLAPGTARSMLAEMASREDRWTMGATCAAYCRLVAQHHYGEDQEVFPLLRRSEAGLISVLERLETEHAVIHELLDRIDAALVAMIGGGATADALATEMDRLTDALLSHLAYEERELLRPMARVFG